MGMNWKKIDRNENSEGTTITYSAEGTGKRFLVQSRKRHILHANATGPNDTWDCTNYAVLKDGEEVKTLWRLSEAKEYAEELIRQEGMEEEQIEGQINIADFLSEEKEEQCRAATK